ncbi:hypothetical protein ABLE92_09565 [Gordonia sp. VNQ95]|uniref:hypothetical protein n=1 Tax=Gordonia sp. VNQ95 TaxID=3156619 RepID=UPI0032B32D5A
MLLLRSVFGMAIEDGLDGPDAVGTTRSQALTSGDGEAAAVRFVASMVPSRLDGAGRLVGVAGSRMWPSPATTSSRPPGRAASGD